MTTSIAKPLPDRIAPLWHTVALVAVIVLVAITGTLAKAPSAVGPLISTVYLPTILVEAMLVFYVARAFRPRSVLRDLVGRAVPTDALVALALAAFVITTELAVGRASAQAHAILPRTGPERAFWIAVAASVGFTEELVYRGYLVVQLRAFTASTLAAVALQAVLFAIAHANQGAYAMLRFGVYALAFGAVAVWRRSLVPTIVCHVGIDALAAFH